MCLVNNCTNNATNNILLNVIVPQITLVDCYWLPNQTSVFVCRMADVSGSVVIEHVKQPYVAIMSHCYGRNFTVRIHTS